MTKVVYLSLGSNLGDRLLHLRDAIQRLPQAGIAVTRISSVFETEPVGVRRQPWFLNCVVEASTDVLPRRLMKQLLDLEFSLGRRRHTAAPMGPRTIDLDLILYGSSRIDTPDLTVPHPRYRQRRFVLAGLAELVPDLRDPQLHQSMAGLLAEVDDPGQVNRLELPDWPPA